MNKSLTWKEIKKKLSNSSGYPDEYFDLVADFNIIELCAKGFSNSTIADFLETNTQEVRYTLKQRTGFEGFEENLQFSPIWWKEELHVVNNSKYPDETILNVVNSYIKLKERIDEYENSRF